jgi:protein gp37
VMAACPQHTFQVLTKRAKRMHEWYEWLANSFDYNEWYANPAQVCFSAAGEKLPNVKTLHNRPLQDVAGLTWPLPNVWVGVTAENQERFNERVYWLAEVPAALQFISCEPLLGPIDLHPWSEYEDPLNWVIVGGESGPGARAMDPEWAVSLRDQCVEANIPFHFKQWGGVHKKEAGCLIEGKEWKQLPTCRM